MLALISTSRISAEEAVGIANGETPLVHIAALRPAWLLVERAQQAAIGFLKAYRQVRIPLRHWEAALS